MHLNRWIRAASRLSLVLIPLAATACCGEESKTGRPAVTPKAEPVKTQLVWVVDDGERVARHVGALRLMKGERNAVWKPGEAVKLFGLPGETVAFQVVVSASEQRLRGVTVDLAKLDGPATITNPEGQGPRAFRPIERFVVHELSMKRRSGGKTKRESLGWAPSAMPPDPSRGGTIPDPLVPVELAPAWADYPMTVEPGEHRVVWVDVTLPDRDLPAGIYRGTVEVKAQEEALQAIPLELEVGDVVLPYAAVATMVYVEAESGVVGRTGTRKALEHYRQLMHRHHLTTVSSVDRVQDVDASKAALTGELYTPARGYDGPGRGVGESVIVLGTYGGFGKPEAGKLAEIKAVLSALAELGLRDEPGKLDIFLYAVDEQCQSPFGPGWRELLDESGDPMLRSLRVGHTCSEPPADQGVDLVMMSAEAYDPPLVEAAPDKHVWIYNGFLPRTGAFLTDAWHVSLRANAWIQQKHGIERWFYWESVFWNDGNRGGHGPYDPLVTAETFHNDDADHCNGDGVLVYPGKQVKDGYRSLGFEGVLPSIRLKQWRRGISDAGYVQLARKVNASKADAIVARMVPRVLGDAPKRVEPSWPTAGEPWTKARRELFELITGARR